MRAVAAALLILPSVIAAGAAYVWQRLQPPQIPRQLERNWRATVAVLAGDGVPGSIDGEASRARFSEPFGIAAAPDGTIFVTDAGHAHDVRRISPEGLVSTIAGGFSTPSGIALGPDGTLYLADTGTHAIRRITPDRQISTVAGDGTPGYVDGPANQARFDGPIGIALARDGRIFVADTYNDRIRVIGVDGMVSTLAGSGRPGADDGLATEASFDTPSGIAIDASGTVYVADTGNGILRIVDQSGRVTTPAWAHGDGFFRPIAIAVGPSMLETTADTDRELYVADEGGRIVAIRDNGEIRTLAGGDIGFHDGPGPIARFRRPSGVALLGPGRLVVADTANALVRVVAATSQLPLQPPPSPVIRPHFDTDTFGLAPLLWPVAPFAGPHEVAGSFGEVRGDDQERFHRGIDVRVEEGTGVYAVRDGIVSSPISNDAVGALDEWLRIGDLSYIHIRAGRTRTAVLDSSRFAATYDGKKLTRLRVKRGARFAAGDLIGTVNRFNHVHMNVGWPGEEHNPLLFRLVRFEDSVPPTIPPDGIRVYDESWRRQTTRVRNRLLVAGRVHVVIDAWDQADDNTPSRRLAPYQLGYQVLEANGSPVSGFEKRHASLRFDRIGSSPDAPRMVYGAGSGIPFYSGGRTRYFYIVTNRLDGGQTSEGFLDTGRMAAGNYIVRVWAADVSGNVTERDLPVTIGAVDR